MSAKKIRYEHISPSNPQKISKTSSASSIYRHMATLAFAGRDGRFRFKTIKDVNIFEKSVHSQVLQLSTFSLKPH